MRMRTAAILWLTLLLTPMNPPALAETPDEVSGLRTPRACGKEAGREVGQLNAEQPLPVGALVACPGIRPGARVNTTTDGGAGSGCTLNFVFRGTSYDDEGKPIDEGLFIGTAGHCYFEETGDRTWAPGTGPVAQDASRRRIGEFSYAVELGAEPFDFALIRIDDEREAEVVPAVCHFGGPTGITRGGVEGDIVHHFGQGFAYGETVQGRSGVLVTGPEFTFNSIRFLGSVTPGDSGGPLIDADGNAFGVITNFLPPTVTAMFLGVQVDRAEQKLDMELDLIEAPFA